MRLVYSVGVFVNVANGFTGNVSIIKQQMKINLLTGCAQNVQMFVSELYRILYLKFHFIW